MTDTPDRTAPRFCRAHDDGIGHWYFGEACPPPSTPDLTTKALIEKALTAAEVMESGTPAPKLAVILLRGLAARLERSLREEWVVDLRDECIRDLEAKVAAQQAVVNAARAGCYTECSWQVAGGHVRECGAAVALAALARVEEAK